MMSHVKFITGKYFVFKFGKTDRIHYFCKDMKRAVNIIVAGFGQVLVWTALTVLSLASCQRDKCNDLPAARVTLQPAIASNVETVIQTRATSLPVTGSSDTYNDEIWSSVNGTPRIKVHAIPEETGTETQTGSFRYSNNKWHSYVNVENGKTYSLYAYSPDTMQCSFDKDARTLTFTKLDIITAIDPMVNIAAAGRHIKIVTEQNANDNDTLVEYEVQTEAIPPSTPAVLVTPQTPTLQKGCYVIGTVTIPEDNTANPTDIYRVWMAMDHLYAKATISFSLDQDYYDIRRIRVTDAKLVLDKDSCTLSGNNTYTYSTTGSFTTALAIDGQAEFVEGEEDIKIDLIKGGSTLDPRDSNQEYATLPCYPEYKDFAWFCFLPMANMPKNGAGNYTLRYPTPKLRITYDVLCQDNETGLWTKVVRKDQVAENRFPIDSFKKDDNATLKGDDIKPGHNFKVKVKVKPTYLYTLADDDAKLELGIE